MARRRQQWEIGDVFTVPTLDGQLALGQIVGREPSVLNSVTVALFDQRYCLRHHHIQQQQHQFLTFVEHQQQIH